MNLKLLLEPKKMVNLIPGNQIYFKLIYVLTGIYVLTFFISLFIHPEIITNFIKDFKTVNANQSVIIIIEAWIIIILIFLATEFIYFAILTLITKLVAKFLKKFISVKKIFNLYIYSQIAKLFIGSIIGLVLILSLKLVNFTGDSSFVLEKLRTLSSEEINNLTYNIINGISSFAAIIFYIYIIKIAVNQNLNK